MNLFSAQKQQERNEEHGEKQISHINEPTTGILARLREMRFLQVYGKLQVIHEGCEHIAQMQRIINKNLLIFFHFIFNRQSSSFVNSTWEMMWTYPTHCRCDWFDDFRPWHKKINFPGCDDKFLRVFIAQIRCDRMESTHLSSSLRNTSEIYFPLCDC